MELVERDVALDHVQTPESGQFRRTAIVPGPRVAFESGRNVATLVPEITHIGMPGLTRGQSEWLMTRQMNGGC